MPHSATTPSKRRQQGDSLLPVPGLQASELQELAAKLRFVPSEGLIWLHDVRMTMLSGEMMASLRSDLVETLGFEPARQLLTRLGYTIGGRDMEHTWKLAGPHATSAKMMDIARHMRALQGFGHIEPLTAFSGAPEFSMELEWLVRNSLEAELHSASFGVGHCPACWIEAGYSAGYLSTYAGKRILVQEVECRALGAPACRFLAKPVERWPQVTDDLAYVPTVSKAPPRAKAGGVSSPEPRRTTPSSSFGHAIGAAAAFNAVLHKIQRVAPTNATVLLTGESGTGKSMFAREIHKASRRANGPFIEVNCAAIPESLIESELFGVERGAFSGATASRPGRFELASGGTIFLDEVATLSMTAQGKLLRVLQTGDIERLGSTTTTKTDVRVIAATNEDLRAAIKTRVFRDDLFFRLNVFPIAVQPLRERREDIPLLAEAFRVKFCQRHERDIPSITPRVIQAMLEYKWPGNIRELENVIERGVILAQDGEPMDIHHVFSVSDALDGEDALGMDNDGVLVSQPTLRTLVDAVGATATGLSDLDALADRMVGEQDLSLSAVEDALTRAALRKSNGNVAAAARLLGVTRAQVDYRTKKLGPTGVS